MSTLEATVSMPEEARRKVFEFTRQLFAAPKPASPFMPLSEAALMADLEEARDQIADGRGLEMREALEEMGKRHGLSRDILHAASLRYALSRGGQLRLCGRDISPDAGLRASLF